MFASQPRIQFSDYHLQQIAKDTGLSKLELMGIIAAMNKYTLSPEQVKRRQEAEARGDYDL